ncbi:MAG: VacJ family lipoprotein [Nitrospinae bacterium]|nr:VacJ family lipoprotein [Nitrospinota bacterium]MBL7019833.1 VacJ family lipoprotein [Nitrospinaceae bacterium]
MEFIRIGRSFFLAGFFLLFLFSSFSWAEVRATDPRIPNFVNDIGDDVFAQTSEVTIKLEKSVPRSTESSSIETAQGTVRSSQDSSVYKEMEDPFAGVNSDIPILTDPFEGYNRWMFGVNETIYDNVLEPVARGYRDTVHEDLRIGIKNLFSNAMAPVKFLSSLIQLDFEKSGRVLARTLINTTFGIGGLADVAGEEYHIEDVSEDFDQAMGFYGIPTGPYVVLPIFGPSTARNIIGRAADSFLSPTFFFAPSTGVSVGLATEENINDASFIVDDKKQLEDSALDEYESIRDFYHQYRHGLVKK